MDDLHEKNETDSKKIRVLQDIFQFLRTRLTAGCHWCRKLALHESLPSQPLLRWQVQKSKSTSAWSTPASCQLRSREQCDLANGCGGTKCMCVSSERTREERRDRRAGRNYRRSTCHILCCQHFRKGWILSPERCARNGDAPTNSRRLIMEIHSLARPTASQGCGGSNNIYVEIAVNIVVAPPKREFEG